MADVNATDDQASFDELLLDTPGTPPSATKAAVREGLNGHEFLNEDDLRRFTGFLRVLDKDVQLRNELRQSDHTALDDDKEFERKRDENLKFALEDLMESRITADAVADGKLKDAKERLRTLKATVSASAQAIKTTSPKQDFGVIVDTGEPEDIDGVLWLIVILSLLTYQIADAALAVQIKADEEEHQRIRERAQALDEFITELFQNPAPDAEITPGPANGGATPPPPAPPPVTNDAVASDPAPTVDPRKIRKLR
ncbi:hypothetical protein [Stenotrophomonas sp.]|uniref:hypothetical protein n=1 Tax=Stenotrophomonas sp. TaxID=69392 RepID=UPI00289E793E|nr:hypothetical protein [Stenotrophomonas sp.]